MTVAGSRGEVALAAHQVAMSVWSFAAMASDAFAIAAQALVGTAGGARDPGRVREVTRRVTWFGVASASAVGVVIGALAGVAPAGFTDDPGVRSAATGALAVVAAAQPLAGYVFMLDGILMGAADGPYLAGAGAATLAGFLPLAWAVREFAPAGAGGLLWLWIAFAGGFMALRGVAGGARLRTAGWRRRTGG
jgi:Na+-driven multidrug efflux pump